MEMFFRMHWLFLYNENSIEVCELEIVCKIGMNTCHPEPGVCVTHATIGTQPP